MNTKTYKVKSLYTQNDGTSTVGAPDYFVDSAIKDKKSIIFLLPDDSFMTLTPEQLEKPYSISEPYVNRYADSIGNANCVFKNYIWKEDNHSILASASPTPGTWDKLVPLKEELQEKEKEKKEEPVSEIEKAQPKKVKKIVEEEEETFEIVKTVTLSGYIGYVILNRRSTLNLKDTDVVDKIPGGLAINTYRAIERGEETNSKINTYGNIAKALGLHISDLFPPKN